MSALEKFKRRLVRDIARRQYAEGQPEEEMWEQLKIEYGCDCYLLWQHMKVLTSKKLKRMLAAEDRMDYITRVARMTSTDWLTFDLVLVHQDVDVIGEEMIQSGKPESPVLKHLFTLVAKYGIETLSADKLVANWAALTHYYNTGGRACSPVLLQRRWYQLKDLTRRRFYDFWRSYRGNPRNLEKSVKPTNLQFQIADMFPNIVTESFIQWKDLIDAGKIVQAFHFETRRRKMESNVSNIDDDPDLVVIEPHVETIEVAADSDNDEQDKESEYTNLHAESDMETTNAMDCVTSTEVDTNELENTNIYKTVNMKEISPKVSIKVEKVDKKISDSLNVENNLNVRIKTEPAEVLELNDTLKGDELIETDNFEQRDAGISQEHAESNDSMFTDTTELVLPKITSIMGSVDMPESHNEPKPICQETKQQDTEEPSDSNYEDPQIAGLASSINSADLDSVIRTEEKIEEKKELSYNSDVVINFNELPPTLEFVDDGIELVENDDEFLQEEKTGTDNDDEINSLDEVDPTYNIDRKLVMFPITYTKKLDDMDVFLDTDYTTIKGNDVIERIEAESKPIRRNIVEMTEYEDEYEAKSDEDAEECKVPRVKYTSWLLQKPKHRNYNPILLCKNPDFNTRLKRLSVGFFLSERNRRLFNACKPLTVDMHKAFETKLVDNVLYLEHTTNPIVKQEKINEVYENTASVIPSAVAVQSLLDKTKEDDKDLLTQKVEIQEAEIDEAEMSPDDIVIDSGEVITKTSMSPICNNNESLLTIEVSPITSKNPLFDNKPPVQLIEPTTNVSQNSSNTKTNKMSSFDAELAIARRLQKKIVCKAKPVTVPQWTMYNSQVIQEESLITKDTLDKVLTLLESGSFPRATKTSFHRSVDPAKNCKKNKYNPPLSPKALSKAVSNQEDVKNGDDTINLTIDDDDVISDKESSKPQNSVNNTTIFIADVRKKRRRRKFMRSISTTSGFCCWSRHRMFTLENNDKSCYKKYRHLCPMAVKKCLCCCRDDLVNAVNSMKSHMYVQTYSINSDPPQTRKVRRDVSIQAQSLPEINGKISILSTVDFYHPQYTILPRNDVQSALETITNVKTFDVPTQFPYLTNSVSCSIEALEQSENDNDDEIQLYKHGSCNTSDLISEKNTLRTTHVATTPQIKTNIIPATPYRKVSAVARAEATVMPETYLTNKNDDNAMPTTVETISLLDDETGNPTDDSSHNSSNTLLPQGINLLLLPDNSLSVSIEPGVKIDPASLSKLPDILAAVQKRLLESGVLNVQRQNELMNALNTNTEINIAAENTELNDLSITNSNTVLNIVDENSVFNEIVIDENAELNIMNPEQHVSQENPELHVSQENPELHVSQENPELHVSQENLELHVSQENPELNVTQDNAILTVINPELNITQRNGELNVMNSKLNVAQENAELNDTSNLELNIAKSGLVLNVDNSNLEPKNARVTENVRKDNSETEVKYTDFIVKVAPETKRKTILSDLMTMSGISPEDANTSLEDKSNAIINQNVSDNPCHLTNADYVEENKQIIPKKKIKKIMVLIKKKRKEKPQSNSVIDLTEDNISDDDNEQNGPPTNNERRQGIVYKKMTTAKNAKLVRVPASAVPLRVYKAAQSLLKKDVQSDDNFSDIDKQMKIQIAKRYRELNRKPTILDILNNIKNAKGLTLKKVDNNESDSSDDEPLAKKSKRMRSENNTDSNDSLSVVPLNSYDQPVEGNNGSMDTSSLRIRNVSTSDDVEEYSILGI